MPSVQERFRLLFGIPAPDLWLEIEGRDPRSMPADPRSRRVIAASVAFLIAAAGIGLAAITFGGGPLVERERPVPALLPWANGQIAISQGPGADIVLLDAERAPGVTLVERHGEGHEGGLQLAWSRDGSKLAYTDYRDEGSLGLFVLDLASRDVLDLSAGLASADEPAWSPDGEAIAFTGFEGTTGYEIYVVASNGIELRPLTSEANNGVDGAYMPAWSPDGTRIAYAFARYTEATETEHSGIAVVDLEGTQETVVVDSPAVVQSPAWSPDGTRLAFLLKDIDVTQVHVASADGSGESGVVIDGMDISATSPPSWSPDGRELLLGSQDVETSNLGVTVVNADGGGAQTLLEDAYTANPTWAPAGDLIAFLRDDAGRPLPAVSLWSMRPDGSDQVELADGLEQVSDIAWRPVLATGSTPSPTMVPDGSISTDGSALPEGRLLVQVGEQRVEVLEEGAETSMVVGRDMFALDLSPDGSRVLVSTPWESVGPETALVSLDLNTGERTVIAEVGGWSLPALWSPDGSRVAYRIGDPNTLCIRDLAIAEPHCLPQIGRVYAFDWSPDGTRLVLDQPPPGSLTVVDVETEQTSVVARWDDRAVLDAVGAAGLGAPVAIQFQAPRWSPSGRYMAALAMVRTEQGHAGNVVLVFDLSGGVIAHGVPFGEFSDARGWSPAADVFAYASGEAPYRIVDARLLDASTGEDRLLVSTANQENQTIQSLAWSPSGRWLAVVLVAPNDHGWFVSEIQILDTTGVDPPRTFRSEALPQLVDWGP